MQEWQQRVINEKNELDGKIDKLYDYLASQPNLDPIDFDLLKRQYAAQKAYSDILNQRIKRFQQ